MATWVNIKTTDYNGAYDNEGVKITLQYDKDSSTPTKLNLRFYATSTSSNNNRYYVLWKPSEGGSGERLFLIKSPGSKATTNSTIITIEKTYTDAKFVIPEYWLIHTGAMAPWKNSDKNNRWYVTYYNASQKKNQSVSVWKFFESETKWWENSRRNFKTVVSKQEFKATKDNGLLATAIGKGTVTITDNGDNTFSITGTKGTSGINNTASGPTLSWGYDTNYGKNVTNPNALDIKTPTNPTRIVYAKGVTKATYGANSEATTSLAIKQYVAPGAPGKPEINYNKSRLTIKENWTYKWTAAEKANNSSPVAGYRIRLYRNGSPIKGLKTTTTSKQLTLDRNSTKDYVDTEKTSTEVIIDPTKFEFVPGDKVKLSVIAYSKNGKGTQLFGNNGYQTYSAESLVQNAGIIRVRVNGSWKEGQVYIRVNGVWKEADVIKIKTPTGWKESE